MMLDKAMTYGFVMIKFVTTVLLYTTLCKAGETESITKHPQSQNVTEGSTVIFTCEFARSIRFSTDERMIWYKNREALSLNGNIEGERQRFSVVVSENNKRFDLKINQVSKNDTGVYFCYFALNREKQYQSISAHLIVNTGVPPTLITEPEATLRSSSTHSTTLTSKSVYSPTWNMSRPAKHDAIPNTTPSIVPVTITTVCIIVILITIIVVWIFIGKKTTENHYVQNRIIIPFPCLNGSDDNEQSIMEISSPMLASEMRYCDVLKKKNATDVNGIHSLISGTPTLDNSDVSAQRKHCANHSTSPASSVLSTEQSPDVLYSKPINTKKCAKFRNVEGITYADLDLHDQSKTPISRKQGTQYAVISI